MRKQIIAGVLMIVSSGIISCKKGFDKTENGLQYKMHTHHDGAKPKQGDVLYMHMYYTNENDSVLFDSDRLKDTFKVMFPPSAYKGCVEEGFALLSEGDSATFIVSADSVFEKTFKSHMPSYVRKGSELKFHIKLNSFITKEKYEAEKKAKIDQWKAEEPSIIINYINEHHYTQQPSASGLYYIELTQGKGDLAKTGDSVYVNYTGKFFDNEVFDSNSYSGSKEPIKFKLGELTMIQAWEEGLLNMREGGTALLICPSSLAYGAAGAGPIKPFTPLVFSIELVKVKPNGTTSLK